MTDPKVPPSLGYSFQPQWMVMTQGFSDPNHMTLDSIKVMGMTSTPANVIVNSKPAKVSVVNNVSVLSFSNLNFELNF